MPGSFNEKASWLPKVKEKLSKIEKHEDIRISAKNVKMAMKKNSQLESTWSWLCSGVLVYEVFNNAL